MRLVHPFKYFFSRGLVTLLFFLFLIPNVKAQYCSENSLPLNLRRGLVTFFPFCNSIEDKSSISSSVTINKVTLGVDRFGKPKSAAQFKRDSISYIFIPAHPRFENNSFSISLWFKTNLIMQGGTAGQYDQSIVSYSPVNWATANAAFNVELSTEDNSVIQTNMWTPRTFNQYIRTNTGIVNSTDWVHFVLVYDGVAKTKKIFINGLLYASRSAEVAYNSQTGLCIGSTNQTSTGDFGGSFDGLIDDFAFWNRPLEDCEITQLYNNFSLPGSPTATIIYSGSPYCKKGIAKAELVGMQGGLFSSELGIKIDEKTGSIDLENSSDGTYDILYSLGSGTCTSVTLTSITILPPPNLLIDKPLPSTCINQTPFTLNYALPVGGKYHGRGIDNNVFDPSISGLGLNTIFYVFTSVNGCTNSISTSIYVNDTPRIIVSPNSSICMGETIQLTAINALKFSWSPSTGLSSITGNSVMASPISTTNYTVQGTDLNGCSASTVVLITVNPLPIANVLYTDGPYCNNGQVIPSLSGQTGGRFSAGEGLVITPDSGIIDLARSNPGSYTVTYSFSNLTCSSFTEVSITILENPKVSFSNTLPTQCLNGNPFLITGGFPLGGIYSGPGIVDGKFYPSTVDIGNQTIFYSFTSVNGCFSSISNTINVVQFSQISLSGDKVICLGLSTTLTALNSQIFSFTPNTSLVITGPSSAIANPITSTTYLVTGIDINGCNSFSSFSVTVLPPISDDVQGLTHFCSGSKIEISSKGLPPFRWYRNGTLLEGQNLDKLDVNQPGNYQVISRDKNGCTSTSITKTIIEHPLPDAGLISPLTPVICEGSSVQLRATGGVSYQWYLDLRPISFSNFDTFSATIPGRYIVDVSSDKGCIQRANNSILLVKYTKPTVNFDFDKFCINKPVLFTSNSYTQNSGTVKTIWKINDSIRSIETNYSHVFPVSSNYKVRYIIEPISCPNLADSIDKIITIADTIKGINYPPVNVSANKPFILNARNIGINYTWSPDLFLNNPSVRNPVIVTSRQQFYKILITQKSGCTTIDSLLVRVFIFSDIFLPTGFTPDNDGINDRFYPIKVGISEMKIFRVFNRWGNLIYDNKNADQNSGWDGTFKGQKLPIESYVWIAEGIDLDGKVVSRSGNVVLIR